MKHTVKSPLMTKTILHRSHGDYIISEISNFSLAFILRLFVIFSKLPKENHTWLRSIFFLFFPHLLLLSLSLYSILLQQISKCSQKCVKKQKRQFKCLMFLFSRGTQDNEKSESDTGKKACNIFLWINHRTFTTLKQLKLLRNSHLYLKLLPKW